MALKTSQISALTTSQIFGGLTTTALRSLGSSQIQALSSSQTTSLTTAQVGVLYTAQISVMNSGQVRALNTANIAALTSSQINLGFTTAQIAALSTNQVKAITVNDLRALSSKQGKALTSVQIASLSSVQMAALTTTQIGVGTGRSLISPIVLDLTGKGIQTTSINNGVNFDLLGNGQTEKTGWIAQGEGLLMLNPNGTESLNDGSQLFGQGTTLANGQKAENGYQALAVLDSNGDGVINAQDAAFKDLGVWVDTGNSNGLATGQFESLSQLGITQLNLNAQASTQTNNGNLVGLISSFQTASGTSGEMADVWFNTQASPGSASTVVTQSTNIRSGALSALVSDLASALSGFAEGAGSNSPLDTSGTLLMPASSSALTNQSLANSMTQFDSNGQHSSFSLDSNFVQVPTHNFKDLQENNIFTPLALPILKNKG